jgi:hypothetical protein
LIWIAGSVVVAALYLAFAFRADWNAKGKVRYGSLPESSRSLTVLYHGWVRTGPFAFLFLSLILVGVLILALVEALGTEIRTVVQAWGIFALTWPVLWIVLFLSNRPSFFIPPHLRDKPGAISEWRSYGRPH